MNIKYTPLVVAIALPIVFVLVLVSVILLPNMNIKPEHDFVYMTYNQNQPYGYYGYGAVQYKNTYDLKDDKIILKPIAVLKQQKDSVPNDITVVYETSPKIYYYDIHNQASHEVSFEEAQKLSLVKGPSSPDGYTISYNNSYQNGLIGIFGSESQSSYVITKGKGKKQLSGIVADDVYYREELTIIGWIK